MDNKRKKQSLNFRRGTRSDSLKLHDSSYNQIQRMNRVKYVLFPSFVQITDVIRGIREFVNI